MSGTLFSCYYLLHLSGYLGLIALYVSICMPLMCLHVFICVLFQQWVYLCMYTCIFGVSYMYTLLALVWFLSTVCLPFFVTALLLMPYSALCVLCYSYLLSITMYINLGAPLACNDLLMY